VDELLPVLVARVANRDEAVPALEAALRSGIAFVALDEPPSYEGPHALELHVPEWTEPVLLVAEPAGDPLGHEHPLSLRPFAPEHEEVLIALLADAGVTYTPPVEAPPPMSIEDPALLDLDLRLSEPPPAEFEASDEPHALAPAQIVGRTLGGKYYVERLLGSGAMGDVYQATHLALRKAIAVKVLHPSHRHNEEFITAFQREALAASRLDHANVVQVIDFGYEPADGLLYIVMELLSGTDLRGVLDQQPVQPLARIVDVMSQVCAALSASHDQNVVHRDVKPDNIILVPKRDDDGTMRDFVKVCDFGIAEIVERHPGDAAQKTDVAGTPDYMAPEQVRGGVIDARTDIYACGVILYEMATGKVPFHAEESPVHIAWAHVQKEPPPPSSLAPSIDKRLEAVITKAMSKDPARRHQSARELRAELRSVAEYARKLASFTEDDDVVPPGVVPQFERADAIDIGDLFAVDPVAQPKPGAVKEQIWVLSEQMATALVKEPAAVLARIEALQDHADYSRDMATLERAMASAAQRGAAASLLVAVTHLAARARGAQPGERSREAVAARALRSIAKPEILLRVAEDALDGPPPAREPARKVLVALGAAGAHALALARTRATGQGAAWAGRARFVAAMREVGAAAIAPILGFLRDADARDVTVLEDLLRAVPDVNAATSMRAPGVLDPAQEQLGTLISTTHVRHEAPPVRRAAAQALAAVWGSRANAWLGPLLEESDDGVRIVALGGLRKNGGVDREVVRRIERILGGAVAAGTELRVAAAAALADAIGLARTAAAEALSQALRPAGGGGFLSKLVTSEARENPEVLATMAQVLLTIGGPEAARVVEARAAKSGPEARQRLMDLLQRGGR
jgi:serine/threonine-protein kinase